jgi:hypothetical protein
MRRLFWLAMGITIGALVVRRLSQLAERLTPKSMASNLGNAATGLLSEARELATEVRASMREREQELRTGTGLDQETARS